MSKFETTVSDWLVFRIRTAAISPGKEIETMNFKTPLYIGEEEYKLGVEGGYINEDGTPSEKFKHKYSHAVIRFCCIKK